MNAPTTIILVPFDPTEAAEYQRALPHLSVAASHADRAPGAPMCYFIDWLLPDGSGLEFCRRLRADPQTHDARIFLMLDEDDRDTQRRALKAGADDYIVGSLSPAIIGAKADAPLPPLSRQGTLPAQGRLRLDRESFQVRAGGQPVPMGPNEFRLLAYLMLNCDRVLSRGQLIGALKDGQPVDERTVDVWIGRLRKALATAKVPDPIRTVRQLGYVYNSF